MGSTQRKTWLVSGPASAAVAGLPLRRHDEVGTPFCVTVNFDTVGKGEDPSLVDTVTVRDRDTLKQDRVKISELSSWIQTRLR